MPVALHQAVKAGQTLAVVDTVLDNEQTLEVQLRAKIDQVTAEIQHLAAQLLPTQELMEAEASNLEINRVGDLRQFSVDVEDSRLAILRCEATIASDRITLYGLAVEVKVLDKLVAEGTMAPYELERVRTQHESLVQKIEKDEATLVQAREDLDEATQRRDRFLQQEVARPSVPHALEVIRKEIKVQEELMRGLQRQLDALKSREAVELRSPIDGVVVSIGTQANEALQRRPGEHVVRRTGEVVTAGDPILAIAEEKPTEIIAYVRQEHLASLKDDMLVKLVKNRLPAQVAQSRVRSIGPTIELMPQRLWRNPNMAEWGRPVVIDIPNGLELVPGELVGIKGL